MNHTLITYLIYIPLSVFLTVWVAHTLRTNGTIFLLDCFHGNGALAESVNHLLVVGFYLINLGFVALFLKAARQVESAQGVVETLAGKLGVVLLVLGVMHFFNLLVFAKARRAGLRRLPPAFPAQPANP